MHVWCLGYKWVWSSAMLTVIRCKKIRSHEVIYLGSPLSLCCVQQRAGELPWNKAMHCKHIIILHIIFQVATALLVAGSTLTFYFTHNIFIAWYPGLLTPAFVACSTDYNTGEGLVKLSHVVWRTWTRGGVAHSQKNSK